MHHAERSGGPVAAAKNCAPHGSLSVVARGRRCTAWNSMRRFDWRLSTSGLTIVSRLPTRVWVWCGKRKLLK